MTAAIPAMDQAVLESANEAESVTYSFHDLFRVRVAHRGLRQMMEAEFPFFMDPAADPEAKVDLVVEEGAVPLQERMLSRRYAFGEGGMVMETASGHILLRDGVLRAEPNVDADELYARWIEGILFYRALGRGAFLAHSSAVTRNGRGYLFPAWAHTGKTNVALQMVSSGYEYMADDWCLVSTDGEILGYPRWLNLFSQNFEAHPELCGAIESRRARRNLTRRLALVRFAKTLNRESVLTTDLRWRIENRFYVHNRFPVERIVRGSRTSLRAPLTKACLLSAWRSNTVKAIELTPKELARRVALTALFERYMFNLDRVAMAYSGITDGPIDFATVGAAVLEKAFGHTRCLEILIPERLSKDDLHRITRLVEDA